MLHIVFLDIADKNILSQIQIIQIDGLTWIVDDSLWIFCLQLKQI